MVPFRVRSLGPADAYIRELPPAAQVKIAADTTLLAEDENAEVRTKQLKGAIRELIIGHHRLTYFRLEHTLYLVRGFRKKTQKTPRNEIEYAEQIYKQLSQQ